MHKISHILVCTLGVQYTTHRFYTSVAATPNLDCYRCMCLSAINKRPSRINGWLGLGVENYFVQMKHYMRSQTMLTRQAFLRIPNHCLRCTPCPLILDIVVKHYFPPSIAYALPRPWCCFERQISTCSTLARILRHPASRRGQEEAPCYRRSFPAICRRPHEGSIRLHKSRHCITLVIRPVSLHADCPHQRTR